MVCQGQDISILALHRVGEKETGKNKYWGFVFFKEIV
jgi:hypothetical protein